MIKIVFFLEFFRKFAILENSLKEPFIPLSEFEELLKILWEKILKNAHCNVKCKQGPKAENKPS